RYAPLNVTGLLAAGCGPPLCPMMRLILIGGRYDPVLGGVAHHFQQERPDLAIRHYRLEDLAVAPWVHRVGKAGAESSAEPGDTQDPSSSECLILNRQKTD